MGKEKAGGAARGSPGVKRTLREARRLIKRGWVQATFRVGDAYCMCGAMNEAIAGDEGLSSLVYQAVRRALGVAENNEIVHWNDRRGRTQAEVLAAFDRAIELASNASAPKEPPDSSSDPEAQRG